MYLVFCCIYIITDLIFTDSSLIYEEFVLTDGQTSATDKGISSSGSVGGPTTGGGLTPGGGPNPQQDPNIIGVSHANTLPRESSNNSLVSDTSYTEQDIKQSAGADIQNMENIMNDKSLSDEEKKIR